MEPTETMTGLFKGTFPKRIADRQCLVFYGGAIVATAGPGVAFALVELLRGRFQRPRQSIELAGRRVAKTPVEQRGRDPDGCGERQQG